MRKSTFISRPEAKGAVQGRRRDKVEPGEGSKERPLSNVRQEQMNLEIGSLKKQNIALQEQLKIFKNLQQTL